jgi:catalase
VHRLGPNYHLIPVHSPKGAGEMSYQRDGFMRVDAGLGLDVPAVERLAAMSAEARAEATQPGTFR